MTPSEPVLTEPQIEAALHQRERLQEIADLRLTQSDVRALLQDLSTRAATELGLPIGLVTIVLDEAQHFAAEHGLGGWLQEAGGTPAEWSFCRVPVATKTPFVVSDATVEPLVQDTPLVTVDGLRCYAGMPLVTSRGFALGSLCVAGVETHTFSDTDLAKLRAFADEVVSRLEARRALGAS